MESQVPARRIARTIIANAVDRANAPARFASIAACTAAPISSATASVEIASMRHEKTPMSNFGRCRPMKSDCRSIIKLAKAERTVQATTLLRKRARDREPYLFSLVLSVALVGSDRAGDLGPSVRNARTTATVASRPSHHE